MSNTSTNFEQQQRQQGQLQPPSSPLSPPSKTSPPHSNGSVTRHALAMASGTMVSRILGLFRELALAALFDKMVTDAWIAAFRLPNLFRRLLGEGALSVSFIPVFVETRVEETLSASCPHSSPDSFPQRRSNQLVNSFSSLLFVILMTLSGFGTLYTEEILQFLLDPSYLAQTEKMALTVKMASIMFIFILLVSGYAFVMGILNALGRFGWAAMAPTFFNLALIVSTLLPPQWFQWPGQALAWGVVVGGVLQIAVLIPLLIRLGYFPHWSWRWNLPEIRKIFIAIGPGLVGMGLLQITTLVNLRFASHLTEGSISYINYADRLLELPLSLISVSLGTALLPTLSQLFSSGRRKEMVDTAQFYLRFNLFLSLPASLALFIIARPLVEILFQRGKFTPLDVIRTADVVRVYSLTMISSSCVRVTTPNFYAVKNTWIPALISAICLCVHLIAAPWLMFRWDLIGLNLSSTLSSTLNLFLLLGVFSWWIGPFPWGQVLRKCFLFIFPAGAMGGVLWCLNKAYLDWIPGLQNWNVGIRFLLILGGLFVAGLFYLGVGLLLKLEEAQSLQTSLQAIWQRLLVARFKGPLTKEPEL